MGGRRYREMRVRVLKQTSNELKIEIEGEGHTFCNALQKVLLEDDAIEVAGYDLPHPLISNPTVYVRTKGQRSPAVALQGAAKKLRKRSREFRTAFQRAMEAWQQG